MKSKALITGVVVVILLGALLALGSTDAWYVAAALGFFLLCAVYAEGCDRL